MSELIDAGATASLPTGENVPHGVLIGALHEHLARKRLTIDAVGHWRIRESWALSSATTDVIARDFALDYRHDVKIQVSYIIETLESLAAIIESTRRRALTDAIVSATPSPASEDALVDWLRAVSGRDPFVHEVAVLRHWIWLVKRALLGLEVEHHLMPVLVGAQGSGKTVAVTKLLGPLQELALVPCDAALLIDQRWRPALGRYVAAFWDELEGIGKADASALKQVITAPSMPYRPMRTTRTEAVPVRTRFIGASNTPVSGLFRDPTGARRFVEIPSAVRCDWAVIDAIDYEALWAGVDARAPAPILEGLAHLRCAQEEQRYRDSVGEWLDQEEWDGFQSKDGQWHDACDLKAGVPADRFYKRYSTWAEAAGHEHPLAPAHWGVRLTEEQFTKTRGPRSSGKRQWVYHRCVIPVVQVVQAKHPTYIRRLKTAEIAEVLSPDNVNGSNSTGNELVLGPLGPLGPVVSHTITSPLSSNNDDASKISQAPPNTYPEKPLPSNELEFEPPF